MFLASRDANIPTAVDEKIFFRRQPDDKPPTLPLHGLDDTENYSQTSADEPEDGGYDNEKGVGPIDGNGGEELGGERKYSIQLNSTFLMHLRSLAPIPKKVHMFFPDKEYYQKEPILPFVSHSIISLMNLNPDWNVTIYDDEMVDNVIRQNVGLLSKEEVDVLIGKEREGERKQSAHIVERTDIARVLLMYTEGGVYIDADRLVSKKIDDFITPTTRLCLPTHFGINFAQDLMCSSQGNEMFLSMIREASTIRMNSERRKGWIKGSTLFDMGPPLYNEKILTHVFGMDSDAYHRHAGEEGFFAQARDSISASHGTIITKRESDYCKDTLVLDDSSEGCFGREELYERYGMKRWGKEVGAVWGE
jgi:hypothetical protein